MTALFVILFLLPVLFLLTVLVTELRTKRRFTPRKQISARHISDEDFLAAVPGAKPETALKIRAIISEQLDIPEHCIHPHDRFIEDLRAG